LPNHLISGKQFQKGQMATMGGKEADLRACDAQFWLLLTEYLKARRNLGNHQLIWNHHHWKIIIGKEDEVCHSPFTHLGSLLSLLL